MPFRAPPGLPARPRSATRPAPSRAASVRSFGLSRTACLLLTGLLISCGDPTRDALIESLGDEAPGVPIGPLHRPGQPCNVCHDGEIAREFSIAGTVYWAFDSKKPAPGTKVVLTDEDGNFQTAYANCAGNFFLLPEDTKVDFPFWVKLSSGDTEITMDSPVNGQGSCAGCHKKTLSTRSTGRVYLYDTPPGPPPEDCQ